MLYIESQGRISNEFGESYVIELDDSKDDSAGTTFEKHGDKNFMRDVKPKTLLGQLLRKPSWEPRCGEEILYKKEQDASDIKVDEPRQLLSTDIKDEKSNRSCCGSCEGAG